MCIRDRGRHCVLVSVLSEPGRRRVLISACLRARCPGFTPSRVHIPLNLASTGAHSPRFSLLFAQSPRSHTRPFHRGCEHAGHRAFSFSRVAPPAVDLGACARWSLESRASCSTQSMIRSLLHPATEPQHNQPGKNQPAAAFCGGAGVTGRQRAPRHSGMRAARN